MGMGGEYAGAKGNVDVEGLEISRSAGVVSCGLWVIFDRVSRLRRRATLFYFILSKRTEMVASKVF